MIYIKYILHHPLMFWSFKAKYLFSLLKLRLSASVVFSGLFGYLLGWKGNLDWKHISLFIIGTFMITGTANIINQITEKDSDKLMNRTKRRPLAAGRMNIKEAIIFATILMVMGTSLLIIYINLLSAILCIISVILYGFVYTPLKRFSSSCVLVGSFPGALPPAIGWVAVTGNISVEAFIIFGFQFIWQFPHFWSIAWIADEDYKKAGFKMLPSKYGKSNESSFQIIIYTLLLIPFGMLPFYYELTGITSAIIVTLAGFVFFIFSIKLFMKGTNKAAKNLLFASLIYLPLVQIILLLDKI